MLKVEQSTWKSELGPSNSAIIKWGVCDSSKFDGDHECRQYRHTMRMRIRLGPLGWPKRVIEVDSDVVIAEFSTRRYVCARMLCCDWSRPERSEHQTPAKNGLQDPDGTSN
jgi:hypothetical protein